MKIVLEVTSDIANALLACSEDSDCEGCPCHMGEDDCMGTYLSKETVDELTELSK